jgi:hypothetical protein
MTAVEQSIKNTKSKINKLNPRHIMTAAQIESLMAIKSDRPAGAQSRTYVGTGGFQLTSHVTYLYTTGLEPMVPCKYYNDAKHPLYQSKYNDINNLKNPNVGNGGSGSYSFELVYDYGIANVVCTPNYTIDRISEIPGTLITGEITGMPLVRKITPNPTRRQTYPEHINAEYDYDRDEYRNDVMNANPDDYAIPWANELTDGFRLSGDRNTELVLPNSRFVFTDIVPTNILKRWEKLPGAVQRFWIGAVFLENNIGERHDVDRLTAEIGRMFHVSHMTVARAADFTAHCMKTPGKKLAGKFTVPDIHIGTDEPIDGDWDLKWEPAMRKPWETLDGERSYAEWGFDGPTDMAFAQRRAMLNTQ